MELRGFEPLTPCMPCKCSARLSYSPEWDGYFTTGSGLADRRRFPVQPWGVAPQAFQIEVPALLRLEQVHNDVTEVDQQPVGIFLPFGSQRRTITSLHLDG